MTKIKDLPQMLKKYDASGDRVATIADGVRTNYLVDPMRGVYQVLEVINMNKRKNLFHLWMSIATDINNTLPNVTVLVCPSCHKLGVDFQVVGDFQTKIGYMAIWCPFCLHGIHISRVRIPEKTQALPFNTSAEEISRRIPNFTHVEPDD